MQGLYELPNSGLEGHAASAGVRSRYPAVTLSQNKPLAVIRHTITHHRIHAVVLEGAIQRLSANSGLSFHPISDLDRLPLTGMTRKALKALGVFR
jgi:adenine-specific DNA glycosylase